MLRNRLLLACAPVGALLLASSPISHAASQLLGYQLVWQSDHSIALSAPGGRLLTRLKPGQQLSLRHGSDVLTLSLQRAPSTSQPSPPPPPFLASPAASSPSPASARAAVRQLLAAINQDRAAHKVPPLSLDQRQSQCSLQHSRHMADVGYASHDQYPQDMCTSHTPGGENVGVSVGGPLQAALWLHHSMMAEGRCPDPGCPADEVAAHGHYLNLVNPAYRWIGIGIFTRNGITWLTEDFAS